MLTRRRMLRIGLAGAAVVGAPLAAASLFSRAHAADGLPLNVVNSTGRFDNSAITMYIVGFDLATGRMGYVRESGRFTPADPAHNGADGFADIGIQLDESGTTQFVLPMMSGRIYFSINERLRFTVVGDGNGQAAVQYPVGWAEGDPAYGVLHDCCEFTYNSNVLACNTTTVDMFSIPMAIRLVGGTEQVAGKLVDGGREAIFNDLANQAGYERLLVGDGLRVIAPGKGIETGRFDERYYDGYLSEVWDRYSRTELRVHTPSGTRQGRVVDGRLAFGDGIRDFEQPSTLDVFYCAGKLGMTNDEPSNQVARTLAAGLNRSTLDQADQPVTSRSAYYQHPITNHYSRVLHRYSADGRAYGFPFDDVVDDSTYIQDTAPREMTITLTSFGGGASVVAPPPVGAVPPPGGGAAPVVPGARTVGQEIAATSFDMQHGVGTEASTEGGEHIGFLANGDWAGYRGVDFGGTPVTQFQLRVASGAPHGLTGLVEIRVDEPGSPPLGSVEVANNGGWQNWTTLSGSLTPVTGVHDVYLTFSSGRPEEFVNVRWLRFSA